MSPKIVKKFQFCQKRLKMTKSDEILGPKMSKFPLVSPKIVKKFQFWALCHLKLSKSFNFAHVSPKIVKKFQFCAQWAQKMKFGPTVSTNIVKKFRFCAQWDKINSPKSIFCPTVSTNIVKKFRFSAQWDKKRSKIVKKSILVPLWTNHGGG